MILKRCMRLPILTQPDLHRPGKLQRSCSARDEFNRASLPPGRGGREACPLDPPVPTVGSAWGVEGPEDELPPSTAAETAWEEWEEAEGDAGGWWDPPVGCGGS